MNKQNKLILGRSIFLLFIIISLGLIIINEKKDQIFIPKVKEKINIYLKENYNENFSIDNIEYKNSKFIAKISSTINKNHYFYVTYSKRKIKDTYKEEYLKGKNLLNHIEKNLEQEINKLVNKPCSITINTTLDNYTDTVKEKIINEDNLINLKIYSINKELLIKNWNSSEITNYINNFIKEISSHNINPKYYKFIITNKNDITESFEISNITEDFLSNPYNNHIVNDILNNNNSNIIKENNIKYKYLN